MVRVKSRYILLKLLFPDSKSASASSSTEEIPFFFNLHAPTPASFTTSVLTKLIREGVATLFGDYGAGAISESLQVKYFSPATATAIVRVGRDHFRLVWAALTCIRSLPDGKENRPCVVRVVRVCGTIRKAAEEAIRTSREEAVKGRSLMAAMDILANTRDFQDDDDDDDQEDDSDDG